MHRQILLSLIVLTILLSSCTFEDDTDKSPRQLLKEQAEQRLSLTTETVVNVLPDKESPGKQKIVVKYPLKEFDVSSGIGQLTVNFASQVRSLMDQHEMLSRVTITLTEKTVAGETIGIYDVKRAEFEEALSAGREYYKEMNKQLELNHKYLLQQNVMKYAKTAQDIKIERVENQSLNVSSVKVSFALADDENEFIEGPLEDIRKLERLVADIVRTVFETDSSIGSVELEAYVAKPDPRLNSTRLLAEFSMEKEDFEVILEKWDDLRYKIYDRIEYTPLFLMDYICEADVTAMNFNETTSLSIYYKEDFKDIDTTVELIEDDAAAIVKALFKDYELVDSIMIDFKAKLPAEEGMVSSDGVHQIVPELFSVTAQRGIYAGLDTEELNSRQLLYNFGPVWKDRASELMIRSNLFGVSDYYREIVIGSGSVTLTLDSCLLKMDELIGNKIKAIQKRLSKGAEVDLEEEIYKILEDYTKDLIFDIHPPYIGEVRFELERVYRDTTGNEIDVKDLGYVVFIKQEEANYWFQTADPDELVWVEEDDESLDIDNDEVLCQS